MRLTRRSVALIAVSAASLALAVLGGIPALLPVACLCAGLVIAALLIVLLAGARLEARRSVHPSIVEPEEPVEVTLDVALRTALPVVATRWRDRLPTTLRGTAEGTVPPTSRTGARLRYEVQGRRRGSHEVGPLTVVVGDAFGLAERTLSATGHDRFVVLPRRRPLDSRDGPGGGTDGTSRMHPTSGLGQDDVIARPYLPGDALKRWHWKATAHHGEPMVRQEESELRPTLLVVLDTEPRVHDQAGFEWSVSAAASIVSHYADRRYDVDLAAGSAAVSLDAGHGLREALVVLALVEPGTESVPLPARDRTTLVLTGRLDSSGAERLLQSVGSRDTVAFVARGTSDEATAALARAGWHVVVRDTSDDLADLWSRPVGVPVP
ncbi:DUF58 domain-containing protein [Aeromicrobium sp. 179-A 4D2 NHS]|uniref:DUF58 domain-containing protein n=1 Tax=Aeromicrobium sp. 179-A 4D2 NHS TaxID=3142375 RepID=UPI0039A39782